MSTAAIHENMMDYVSVLSDVMGILRTPRRKLKLADRRAISNLLVAMTDINAMAIYHLDCQQLSEDDIAALHAKVDALVRRATNSRRGCQTGPSRPPEP